MIWLHKCSDIIYEQESTPLWNVILLYESE